MKRYIIIVLLSVCNILAIASPAEKSKLRSLLRMADFYIASSNYDKAAQTRDQALDLFRLLGPENDLNTISLLHQISHAYSEKGMYNDAVITESVLVEVFPIALPNNKVDYALYINDLSFYLMQNNCMDLATTYINKAMSIIEGETDATLAIIYVRAAEIYSVTSPRRLDLSIKYQEKAVDLYAIAYGKTNSTYLDELWYLASYYEDFEKYEEACNAFLEIMRTRADDVNEDDMGSFLPLLDRIIFCSRKIGNLDREKQCKEIALNIKLSSKPYHEAKYNIPDFPSEIDSLETVTINEHLMSFTSDEEVECYITTLPDSYGKAFSLSYESLRNCLNLNWDKAIYFGVKAVDTYDSLGVITDEYVMSLCSIAQAYRELHNYAKAYQYILRAYELRDDYLSSDDMYYDGIIHDLALYSMELGKYEEAIEFATIVVKEREYLIYSDNSYGYFNSLDNLASCYGALGYSDLELEIRQSLVQKAEEIDPNVLEFAESPFLSNLARSYSANGEYEKAIEIGLRVKEMREKWGLKQLIANTYMMLARTYRRNSQIDEALYYANQANSILKDLAGEDNLTLAQSFDLLAIIYNDMRAFDKAEQMERYAMQIKHSNIVNNFGDLPSNDRASYWDLHSSLFSIWYPNYFYRSQSQDASELFNKSALFAKGLLLNSDTSISALINESGDELSAAKYQQLLYNKSLIAKLDLNDNPVTQISIDSLRKENQRIERELIQESKAFGDYTRSMKTTWQDVQAALGAKDVAIEFLSFPLIDEQDNVLPKVLYIALVVRKKDATPHYVGLFEESELDEVLKDGIYNKRLYNLVWGKLNKYLSGVDNIYFSPAGKLHNINIEVLPEVVGKKEKSKYYRLSSTRILANNNERESNGNVVIYGGIRYNASVSNLITDSQLYKENQEQFYGDIEDLGLRSGCQYLPGTLTEVNAIQLTLEDKKIPFKIFTGTHGTEASFKSLNGHANKIIHIATHGFYYSESDSLKMKKDHFDFTGNMTNNQDYSLTRSGLLMAGCDNVLHGEQLPQGIDDGVLFSKEIANLNFKNVELVTLSACDSGLGDITGEGVYGLQRAFKKAGAEALLMSLWQVDDNATCILMTKFYENFLSKNMSKMESLREAQRYVRTCNDGKYANPRYWAAFVILDAL